MKLKKNNRVQISSGVLWNMPVSTFIPPVKVDKNSLQPYILK
jgi:hypothetical protein